MSLASPSYIVLDFGPTITRLHLAVAKAESVLAGLDYHTPTYVASRQHRGRWCLDCSYCRSQTAGVAATHPLASSAGRLVSQEEAADRTSETVVEQFEAHPLSVGPSDHGVNLGIQDGGIALHQL